VEDVELSPCTEVRRQMHDRERTERTVMRDVGIGDRKNHAKADAKFPHQQRFEVDDIRRTVRLLLGVHAVVGGDADDSAEIQEFAQFGVDARVNSTISGASGENLCCI